MRTQGRIDMGGVDLSPFKPVLVTHHGSVLCLDRIQCKLKHVWRTDIDPDGRSLARVQLDRDAGGGRFSCLVDGKTNWLQVSPDGVASLVETAGEATVFAVDELSHADGSPRLALRLGEGYLCAHRHGHCGFGVTVARDWEQFVVETRATDILAYLPDVIEFHGEFGAELILFLPFCEWASRAGILADRELRVHAGMRCFYDHMNIGRLTEKTETRNAMTRVHRPIYLPVRDEHVFRPEHLSALMVYPNLRAKFARMPIDLGLPRSGRKLLVVHNKSVPEWTVGPLNRIPLDTLECIFDTLSTEFDIVYIRHGMRGPQHGYSDDVESLDFGDRELLQRFPSVLVFDDLHADHLARGGTYDVNTFKNVLYSRCFHFITSQGGGAHHIAMFEGSIVAVMHVRGRERVLAYRGGYYSFMARIPPLLLVAGNAQELQESAGAFRGSAVIAGRVHIASEHFATLERFAHF